MRPFNGKVAIVTGAGSGLGREYALALAAHGAAVVVNDPGVAVTGDAPTGGSAQCVTDEIIVNGGRAVASGGSVAAWVSAEGIVSLAISEFGRLDIVINYVGNNRPSSLVDHSEVDADLQLDAHLKGTRAVSHFVASHWAAIGATARRAIINTISAVGLHPAAGGGVYGAAKAGVTALTVSHAQELAKYGYE